MDLIGGKMYRVLCIDNLHIGLIEEMLNDEAEKGYTAINFSEFSGRMIIIMVRTEKPATRGPGRPSKKDNDSAALGE
jgi:hypothetical protein